MVLPQLIQSLSAGDYGPILMFFLYFAGFGIIIRTSLEKTALKDRAGSLGAIVGLIFAVMLSSFDLAKGGVIKIPGIALPTVSGYRGAIFSAGGLIPLLMLALFIVLTYGLAQLFIGKKRYGREKDFWIKLGYYLLAGFIVFILLGNISPDLSGMVGAGIARIFNTTLRPVIDLIFFGIFVLLLIKLMKQVKMSPVERDVHKKTQQEKEEEWIQKKNINKEKSVINRLEKGLKGLKEKSQIETLTTIRDLLGKIQYVKTTEESERLGDAMLSEISSKIDKAKPDRKNTIEFLDSLVTDLKKINATEDEINTKITEIAIKRMEDMQKMVPGKAEEIGRMFTEKVDKLAKHIKELIKGKNQHLEVLKQIKAKIEGFNIQFNTKIDELRRNIEGGHYVPAARKSCEEAIIIEEHLQKALEKAVEVRDSYVRWQTEDEKRLELLMANEDAISEMFDDLVKDVKKKMYEKPVKKIQKLWKQHHENIFSKDKLEYCRKFLSEDYKRLIGVDELTKIIKAAWEAYTKLPEEEQKRVERETNVTYSVLRDGYEKVIGMAKKINYLIKGRPFSINSPSTQEYINHQFRIPIVKLLRQVYDFYSAIGREKYKKALK